MWHQKKVDAFHTGRIQKCTTQRRKKETSRKTTKPFAFLKLFTI